MKRRILSALLGSMGPVMVLGILIVVLKANAQGRTTESASRVQASDAQLGTAFTYQGRLGRKGTLVNGPVGFQFRLYDGPISEIQVGPTIASVITVSNGLFTADLDFGPVFTGSVLYLQVGVTGTSGTSHTYTTLEPRQQIMSSPYALYSTSSATATAAISSLQTPWDGLTDVPADFADEIDNEWPSAAT